MNLNTSPYFDDYSAEKNYSQILVVPGRTAQAREVTQIQTMFLDFMRRFGDSVLKDGGIVAGCEVIIDGTNISIAEGKVYHQGLVRRVPHSMVTITGVGREYVGVKVVETVVTENEDPTLLDPAQGYENFNQPGAHRVKQEIVVVANDPDSAILYKFDDGQIVMEVVAPQVDSIVEMLARRTFDESGNYKVQGLDITNKDKNTETTVSVNVESGKAYIRGYEVVKPHPVEVTLDKALSFRLIQYEPKVYLTATPSYKLNNAPLKQMSKLVATVQITQAVTRGTVVGGLDALPFTPVVDIVSISDGSHSYVKNTDYVLNDDQVDWSPGGVEPSIGSSYTVTWRYNKELTLGVDYAVNKQGEDWYVTFLSGGDKPVQGSTFTLDYEFYLARKDLLLMNKYGEILIVKGQPDVARLCAVPIVDNVDLLRLGSVFLPPNSNNVLCVTQSITNVSMEKIHRMLTRIEELEYNDAIKDLDDEAMAGEPPSELKGILTDGFIGFTKADLSHAQFTAGVDISRGELTLPSNETLFEPVIDTGVSKASISNRLITAKYTEKLSIEQPHATEIMLVNPYAVFDRKGMLRISPTVDNWIENSTVIIDGGTTTRTVNIRRWWWQQGTAWTNEERRILEQAGFSGVNSNTVGTSSNTTTRVAGERVLDEAVTFMRQINIQIEADNFTSLADNITCKFDGKVVNLVPQSPDFQGTAPGTLKADGLGRVRGHFVIPPNVRTGTRKVEIYNNQNYSSDTFSAEGRKRTLQRTVIHERTILNIEQESRPIEQPTPPRSEREERRARDPLAQSFGFETDTMLTSVGVFFKAKDSSKPVVVQIRNMVNGYPGIISYGEKILHPADVKISDLGTVETKVTFDDPIYCLALEQYCVVLITESNVYSVFVAGLGAKDVRTGAKISSNPYIEGVLFSSANALTWTAHQDKDMKFRIYTANFGSGDGVVTFQPITGVSFDRIMLMADFATPQNTRCNWEFRINSGPWTPIAVYDDVELSQIATTVQLRATLSVDGTISAIVAKDSLKFVGFTNELISDYVSRNMVLSRASTLIKQVVEMQIPSGSEAQVMFATDVSGTNWTIQSDPVVEVLGEGYVRYTYTKTLGAGVNNFRARIKLQTSSPVIIPKARKLLNIIK